MALAEGRPLRLVATKEGLPLYEKLGFVTTGEIRQHQGEVRHLDRPDGVEDMQAGDLESLKALDREAYGADRSALIDALVRTARSRLSAKGKQSRPGRRFAPSAVARSSVRSLHPTPRPPAH